MQIGLLAAKQPSGILEGSYWSLHSDEGHNEKKQYVVQVFITGLTKPDSSDHGCGAPSAQSDSTQFHEKLFHLKKSSVCFRISAAFFVVFKLLHVLLPACTYRQ